MYDNQLGFEAQALKQRCQSGARWFFWIAGLSLITSIVTFSGGGFAFFLSLGTTQVIVAFARGLARGLGDATKIVGLVLVGLAAGVVVLLGWLALERRVGVVIVCTVLFMRDW